MHEGSRVDGQESGRARAIDPTTGNKLSTVGKARLPRFKRMRESIDQKPPPTRKNCLPYTPMVDASWKAKMEAEGIAVPVLLNPPIMSLVIPMEDLDEEERMYFADDDVA